MLISADCSVFFANHGVCVCAGRARAEAVEYTPEERSRILIAQERIRNQVKVRKSGTAAVKSLHPNICIAVHCSISLHPQLPWYHESAHHWG